MSKYKTLLKTKFWEDELTVPAIGSTLGLVIMMIVAPAEFEWIKWVSGGFIMITVIALLSCYASKGVLQDATADYVKALERFVKEKDVLIASYEKQIELLKELQKLTTDGVENVK